MISDIFLSFKEEVSTSHLFKFDLIGY